MSTPEISIVQEGKELNVPEKPKTAAEILRERGIALESSKPLSELDAAAKRRRYQELRSKLGQSRLKVVGEPGKHYLWAPHDDQNELARLDSLDYKIVREPNAAAILKGEARGKIQANGLREDGTYVLGDVILVECSEEVFEFIMLNNSERHEEMASGAQRDFRTEAERLAVPTFDHVK